MGTSNRKESKGKGGKIALIACLVVIIALLVVVIVLLLNRNKPAEDLASKRDVVVTEDNVKEVVKAAEETTKVGPGAYEVTMNSTWRFADGKSPSENAYVENSTSNTNDVYFDILMSGSEEVIYQSPVIPVGEHISNIQLDKELSNGTYDCVCVYNLVDKDQNPLSQVRVAVQIVIGQ